MNCILKYKNKPVINFNFNVYSTSTMVDNASVVDEKLLPFALRNIGDENLSWALNDWLKDRCISGCRHRIDEFLISLYKLHWCDYGRMYYYQHICAFLSHYASLFDNYIIDVERPEILCFILEDINFTTMFSVSPFDGKYTESIDKYISGQDTTVPNDFRTKSLTIPSALRSWCFNGILYQGIDGWSSREYVKEFFPIYEKYCCIKTEIKDDILVTDTKQFNETDCILLSDIVLNHKYNTSDNVQKDGDIFKYIVSQIPNAENAASELKKLLVEIHENKINISICQIGIIKSENEYKIFIIL